MGLKLIFFHFLALRMYLKTQKRYENNYNSKTIKDI